MKITGTYQLAATPEMLWTLLVDDKVLQEITPGVNKLDRIEGEKFIVSSEMKVGPVRGAFEGKLELKDMVQNESMTVVLDQKSKMGNAAAEIVMQLVPQSEGGTQVVYEGDARMTGTLASMGQRIMGGVISTLSKQFFKGLEAELESRKPAELEVLVEENTDSLWQKILAFFQKTFWRLTGLSSE